MRLISFALLAATVLSANVQAQFDRSEIESLRGDAAEAIREHRKEQAPPKQAPRKPRAKPTRRKSVPTELAQAEARRQRAHSNAYHARTVWNALTREGDLQHLVGSGVELGCSLNQACGSALALGNFEANLRSFITKTFSTPEERLAEMEAIIAHLQLNLTAARNYLPTYKALLKEERDAVAHEQRIRDSLRPKRVPQPKVPEPKIPEPAWVQPIRDDPPKTFGPGDFPMPPIFEPGGYGLG